MKSATAQRALVLDDGQFYVELQDPGQGAAGFLQRRCYEGATSPDGYECVGTCQREDGGAWLAQLDAAYDAQSGSACKVLGPYRERLDAIVALWSARHRARRRHLDD